MPVPKRKTSKSARDSRRAENSKYVAPTAFECPHCKEPKLSHRVCTNCGHYNGKEVISVK